MQLHETVMGKRLIEGTLPALVKGIEQLRFSNMEIAQALYDEIHALNESLKPKKMERQIVTLDSLAYFLSEDWRPVPGTIFEDCGVKYIVAEREVQDEAI